MDPGLYSEFLACKARGDREGARRSIQAFCASFASLEEKVSWTKTFLESGDYGHRIRHELYVSLVFPALYDGYQKKDLWSTLWLARTSQNLYRAKSLHAKLGHPSDFSLLHQCHQIDPNHPEVRAALLDAQVEWLRYCIHEWPAGVLYGTHGATRDQCEEILEEVAFARELDKSNQFSDLFDDVEQKTREYMTRAPANHSNATS